MIPICFRVFSPGSVEGGFLIEEENISVLILAASIDTKDGPGPIINSILTKNYARIKIPVMIVPGNLSKDNIKQIG